MIAQTTTKIEQAELLIVAMDAAQDKMNQAQDEQTYFGAKADREGAREQIEMLGYQVERCVNGWRLASATQQVEEEETSVAAMLHEDEQGLYASVPSSNGRTSYTVRVCARWLRTCGCNCKPGQFGKDCRHQVQIDAQLRDIRPTFSEWIAGKGASQETIASLVATPDRYREPLKGSGVTGFRAAEVERKLAA